MNSFLGMAESTLALVVLGMFSVVASAVFHGMARRHLVIVSVISALAANGFFRFVSYEISGHIDRAVFVHDFVAGFLLCLMISLPVGILFHGVSRFLSRNAA